MFCSNNSDGKFKSSLSNALAEYDQAKVRQNWLEHARLDLNELKAKELVKLDYLAQQVWAKWRHSQQPQSKFTPGKKCGKENINQDRNNRLTR
ncbi:MAG: hypothetical protein ACI88A_001679 [Paraglaciecola sp.]